MSEIVVKTRCTPDWHSFQSADVDMSRKLATSVEFQSILCSQTNFAQHYHTRHHLTTSRRSIRLDWSGLELSRIESVFGCCTVFDHRIAVFVWHFIWDQKHDSSIILALCTNLPVVVVVVVFVAVCSTLNHAS